MISGKAVNGSMLIELAESYINALNEGRVPTIQTAWQYVQKSELERAFELALKQFVVQPSHSNLDEQIALKKQIAIDVFKQEVAGFGSEPEGAEMLKKLK